MKKASDFRRIARDALYGKWKVAVLTGFVASLIGANIATSSGGSTGRNDSSDMTANEFLSSEILEKILPILLVILAIQAIWLIVTAIIGGAGKLGYAKFNLNLIDGKPAVLSDLFSQFSRLGAGFCMNFLMGLYIVLWSLLLIIPGMVKAYSYSMAPYILAEHPEMTANEAITESRRVMQGNKGRLFCLHLSFIGWVFFCFLPMLILIPFVFLGNVGVIIWMILSLASIFVVNLFLTPYIEAAQAAFYREVSNTASSDLSSVEQES